MTTVHTGHAPGEVISGETLIAKTRGRTVDEPGRQGINQPRSPVGGQPERAETGLVPPPAQHEHIGLRMERHPQEAALVARVEEDSALLRDRTHAFHEQRFPDGASGVNVCWRPCSLDARR